MFNVFADNLLIWAVFPSTVTWGGDHGSTEPARKIHVSGT